MPIFWHCRILPGIRHGFKLERLLCVCAMTTKTVIGRPHFAAKGATIQMSEYCFPTFRCTRPVTTEEVKSLEDEE